MADVMEQGRDQQDPFFVLGDWRRNPLESFNEPTRHMQHPDAMGKPAVIRSRKHTGAHAQLVDAAQSLDLSGVNQGEEQLTYVAFEADEPMNRVEDVAWIAIRHQ
ncbi:MAG: hypothetical protein Q8K99_00210 [Actinomycetota bacterium]|nr:hypothetical protein [Actinomycetota bacterium]